MEIDLVFQFLCWDTQRTQFTDHLAIIIILIIQEVLLPALHTCQNTRRGNCELPLDVWAFGPLETKPLGPRHKPELRALAICSPLTLQSVVVASDGYIKSVQCLPGLTYILTSDIRALCRCARMPEIKNVSQIWMAKCNQLTSLLFTGLVKFLDPKLCRITVKSLSFCCNAE